MRPAPAAATGGGMAAMADSGIIAWLLWLGVHLLYITGFKNRLTTLLHWTVSFVGRDRSERTEADEHEGDAEPQQERGHRLAGGGRQGLD